MDDLNRRSWSRCLLVEALVTTALAALGLLVRPVADQALPAPGATFDQVLVGACAVAVLVAAAWLWLVTTVVVAEALRGASGGRASSRVGVPRALRVAVLAACGAALVVPAPALGAERPHPLDGLPMPDRATSTSAWVAAAVADASRPGHGSGADVTAARTHLVRAGDSLWALAAADLSPAADPRDVARRAHRLHQLNRAVIGDDPDLIHPGQRLHLPPAAHRGDHS